MADENDKKPETKKRKKRKLTPAQIEQRRNAARARKGTKNGYTMSEKAYRQRVAAAQMGTGPKTPEGRAACSRSNYKHGLYSKGRDFIRKNWTVGAFAKPCKTSCQYHPDNPNNKNSEAPTNVCTLVLEGVTRAGQDCLDKTVFVTAFDQLMKTLSEGKSEHMHEVLAAEAAGALEILQRLREEIADNGFLMKVPAIDKNGTPILDSSGEPIAVKWIPNPVLPHYHKLLGELGISLPEMLATPRAAQRLDEEEARENTVASLLGAALGNVASSARRGRILEPDD